MSPRSVSRSVIVSLIIGVAAIILLAIGWSLRTSERSLIAANAIVDRLDGSTTIVRYESDFEIDRPGETIESRSSMELPIDLPTGMQPPDPGDAVIIYFPPGEPHEARLQPPSTRLANSLLIAGITGIAIAGLILLLRPRAKAS